MTLRSDPTPSELPDNEQPEDDDDIDKLFDWAVNTFSSGGTDLNEYTATLNDGTLTSVSDGTQTLTFEEEK